MTPSIFAPPYTPKNYLIALEKAGFVTTDDTEEADGLLLPGGGDIAPCLYGEPNVCSKNIDLERDNYELFLTGKFYLKAKPILAICRGLQVVNVFFGGSLKQDIDFHSDNRDVPVHCSFYGKFKELYGAHGTVLCNHHQAVARLGRGLHILAVSDDNVIEAFSRNRVLATQFHPERMDGSLSVCGEAVFLAFKEMFACGAYQPV